MNKHAFVIKKNSKIDTSALRCILDRYATLIEHTVTDQESFNSYLQLLEMTLKTLGLPHIPPVTQSMDR